MKDSVNSILSETVAGYPRLPDGEKQQFLNDKTDKVINAFAEAGYIKPEDDIEVKDNVLRIRDLQLMTGQEWYDRFEKELKSGIKPGYSYSEHGMLQAAKRAAGLTDA